jgi:hypothetical protein
MALVARGKRKSEGRPGSPAVSLERAREDEYRPHEGQKGQEKPVPPSTHVPQTLQCGNTKEVIHSRDQKCHGQEEKGT